jgi:hypothetical protein
MTSYVLSAENGLLAGKSQELPRTALALVVRLFAYTHL